MFLLAVHAYAHYNLICALCRVYTHIGHACIRTCIDSRNIYFLYITPCPFFEFLNVMLWGAGSAFGAVLSLGGLPLLARDSGAVAVCGGAVVVCGGAVVVCWHSSSQDK